MLLVFFCLLPLFCSFTILSVEYLLFSAALAMAMVISMAMTVSLFVPLSRFLRFAQACVKHVYVKGRYWAVLLSPSLSLSFSLLWCDPFPTPTPLLALFDAFQTPITSTAGESDLLYSLDENSAWFVSGSDLKRRARQQRRLQRGWWNCRVDRDLFVVRRLAHATSVFWNCSNRSTTQLACTSNVKDGRWNPAKTDARLKLPQCYQICKNWSF